MSGRIRSIDIVRGAVMGLMAIDHVRVFSGVPAGGPSPAVFFTRWITHFCAPVFVFLAGTSAYLYGRKHDDVSRFLLSRGVWLVLLELTVIRVSWTFNFEFAHYMLAGVIWVIGWSMILMAGLTRLPTLAVGAIGLVIVAGHNAVGPRIVELVSGSPDGAFGWLGKILYVGSFAPPLFVLYTIVPWVGVMAVGYAFGRIIESDPARRRRLCLQIGLSAIALFLVLRGFDLYGDPRPWRVQAAGNGSRPPILAFLNTTKYPASLSFLLMTLGPAIALLPLLERAHGRIARWLTVFGRVPFFFYLLHIPLIHVLALLVSRARLGEVSPWLFANHPMGAPEVPEGYTWGLGLLYAVWALAIVALYFACARYADLKAGRESRWLRYL